MKFKPSSKDRRKASSDSSSVPPFHCFPPIPHAPYPTSLISSPVLPSFRYLINSMVLVEHSNPGPPNRVKLRRDVPDCHSAAPYRRRRRSRHDSPVYEGWHLSQRTRVRAERRPHPLLQHGTERVGRD